MPIDQIDSTATHGTSNVHLTRKTRSAISPTKQNKIVLNKQKQHTQLHNVMEKFNTQIPVNKLVTRWIILQTSNKTNLKCKTYTI